MSSNYEDFNKFQIAFYTSIKDFDNYTSFELNKYGYQLLNNLAKGFPNLVNIIMNLNGINWSGSTSPALFKSLQRRFVNEFIQVKVPQFIYFKNFRETTSTKKQKELDAYIKQEICNILVIDNKTFQYLSDHPIGKNIIGSLTEQLTGEFINKKKPKVRKLKQTKSI